jgi:outer membrane protein assembly factor BamB
VGDVLRLRLEDGFTNPAKEPLNYVWNVSWRQHWAVFSTVAVRGETAFAQSHHAGVVAHQFGKGTKWWGFPHPESDAYSSSTPGIAGVTLSKEHCVFATVRGELYAVAIDSTGTWPKFQPAPFKFETPSGKVIASCPVIADGCVYFGSDDGHLYGLSSEGSLEPEAARDEVSRPLSKVKSPTGKTYAQPGPYGTQANSNYVDDAGLKAPLRLRWAIRTGSMLKAPMCASAEDVFYLGMDGTVGAVEQETGRIRWRRRLDVAAGWLQSPLYDRGRLYVPRKNAFLYCLNASDGTTKWSRPIGAALSPYPSVCGNVVAYASAAPKSKNGILQAYDAETGKELWQFDFGEDSGNSNISGCVLDGTMYFSCSDRGKSPGLTIAVEPESGKVLWRSEERYTHDRNIITGADGRLYVARFTGGLFCLKASDGSLIWEDKRRSTYRAPSVGPELMTTRSYGGGDGPALNPQTGEMLMRDKKPVFTGAFGHTCGPVMLTASGLSLAVTVTGLHVRDLSSGRITWSSLGFAPRDCAVPTVASGRIFVHPQNGMLYCFEPAGTP